ncbi:hypothetical protein ACFE04_028265 [Oxalis oulophora]
MMHQFIISDSSSSSSSINNETQQHQQHYDNSYTDHFLPSIHSLGERMSRSMDLVQAEQSEMCHPKQYLMDLCAAANETQLSLGSHMLLSPLQYKQRPDIVNPSYLIIPREQVCNPDVVNASSINHRWRFLKATQSLLDEVIDLGSKQVEFSNQTYVAKLFRRGLASELKAQLCGSRVLIAAAAGKHQEFQIRIAKLISLLEEVENRYGKYYHQMEQVVSSFEAVAGEGSAKSYTALALQAMSRHFDALRDAILSQINVCRRKLSHDLPKNDSKISGMSLQHLGMIPSQKQAWRPIRGLPETSVFILRSWLFEHFLHPYPNDSEKLMLASQTGLTKNQVSNWFINARVRLWKPMIEEMYKEELAESSEDSNPVFSSGSMTWEEQAED